MSVKSKGREKGLHNNQLVKFENLPKGVQVRAARRRFYEMLKCIFKRSDLRLSESMDDIDTYDEALSTTNYDPRQLFPESFLTPSELEYDKFNCQGSLCNLYDICNVFNEEYEIFKLDGGGSADVSDIKSPKELSCMKIRNKERLSLSNKEANNMVKSQRNAKRSQTNNSLTKMESDTGYSQHNRVSVASKKTDQSIPVNSTRRSDAQNNKDMRSSPRKVNKTRELKSNSGKCCNFPGTDFCIFNEIDPITMGYICQGDRNKEEDLKNNSDDGNQESIKPFPEIFYWARTLRRDTERCNHDIHSNFHEDVNDYDIASDNDSDEYWEYELDQIEDMPFEECHTNLWKMNDFNTALTDGFMLEDVLALMQTTKKISGTSLKSVHSKHTRNGRMKQSTSQVGVKMPERKPSRSGIRGDRNHFISAAKKARDLNKFRHEPVKFQQTPQMTLKIRSAPVDNFSSTSITRNVKMMREERRALGSSPHTSPERRQTKSSLKGSMIAKALGTPPHTSPERLQSKSSLKGSMIAKALGSPPYTSPERRQSKSPSKGSMIAKALGTPPHTSPERLQSKSSLKGSMIAKALGSPPYTSPERRQSKSPSKGSMIAKALGSSPYTSPERRQSKSSLKGSMIAKILKANRNAQSPTNRKQSRPPLTRSKDPNAKPLTPLNKQRAVSKKSSKSKTVGPRGNSAAWKKKKNQKPGSTPKTPPSRGKEQKEQTQMHTSRPHQRPKSAVKCPTWVQPGRTARSREREGDQKTGRINSPQKRK